MGQPWEPVWVVLEFTPMGHTQTNWSWAAMALAISYYFDPNTQWTQCAIANSAFNRTDCCVNPGSCNVSSSLDAGLTATGNLISVTGPVEKDSIVEALRAGLPVGVHISWPGGGGHTGVIIGYFEAAGPEDNHFFIWEPDFGQISDVYANGFFLGGWGDYDATYFSGPVEP